MVVCVYAIPVLATVQVGVDWDSWWHLRVGQWVVENGTVPATDPFSSFGQNRQWVAYSWLFEVLLYGLYCAFGLAGLIVYRALMALAIVAAVHRLIARRERRFLVATGLTALAALAVAMLFKDRPWLFTILFTTLTLDVILARQRGATDRSAYLLPAVFAFWANLHIQFVYGLLLLGLACTAPILDWMRAADRDEDATHFGSPGWWRLTALTVLCAVATLCNPYHVRLYAVVLEYATQPGPFRFVNELKAPEFREASEWAVLALAGYAAFGLGRRLRLRSFEVLLLAATAFLAFRARRDLWLLTVASLAILTGSVRDQVPLAQRFAWTPWRVGWVTACVCLIASVTAVVRDLSPRNLQRRVAAVFPVEAANVVAERGYAGPLYNDFNWGGYLIWALPRLPVALDGRTNLHGDDRMQRFGATWAGAASWHDDPDLSAAGVVIADATSPLASLLLLDQRFTQVHEDGIARVFVARRNLPAVP
jgi:hypothetical protein